MDPIVNQVHKLLLKNKRTLAVAESCTGGLLSKLLTDTSGSSRYFILGIIPYSNAAKQTILNIPMQLIMDKGAVSEVTARLMAQSVRNLSKTDFGVGITGIAGPEGSVPQKPVGTVFIAIDNKHRTICKKFRFAGNRLTIRKKAALKTLELLKPLI